MWRKGRAIPAAPPVRRKAGKARLEARSLSRNWLSLKKTRMSARWFQPKFDWDSIRARVAGFRMDRNFPVRVSRPKSCSSRAQIWKRSVAELIKFTPSKLQLPLRDLENLKSGRSRPRPLLSSRGDRAPREQRARDLNSIYSI